MIHDGAPMAFPSRDVTETFVGPMLGMTSPEAERALMEQSTARREIRNETVPKIWQGAAAPPRGRLGTETVPKIWQAPTDPGGAARAPTKPKTVAGYVPEGF